MGGRQTHLIRMTWCFRLALMVALATISWLALTEKPPDGLDLGWDKFNHVAAFSVLAGLVWFSNVAPSKPRYLGYVLVLTYGILLECLQTLTPNRVFEWSDIAADVAGIIIYAIALHHLAIRLPVLRSLVRIEAG